MRLRRLLRWCFAGYGRPHLEVAVVLVVACVSLAGLQYYGKPYSYPALEDLSPEEIHVLQARVSRLVGSAPEGQLDWVRERNYGGVHRLEPRAYMWWAGSCVAFYALLPLAAALALCRGRLAELSWLGLSPRGMLRHAWVYGILFLLVLPAVVLASFGKEFQHTYPFLLTSHVDRGDWLRFEACYLTQFLCLELFFRGFLLFALEKHIGRMAIFVMVVPYCMIHFGKPFPETLGAVVAGLVLGDLALRFRSIWGGVAIHCAVAVLMDTLALYHAGSLGRLFTPG